MSDDITFCLSDCSMKLCFRHPSNIQEKTIPHSYADFKGSGQCEYSGLDYCRVLSSADMRGEKDEHID